MKRDLRIIFMGTPEFAIPSLKQLLDHNYHVEAVVTAQDKPSGRGRRLTPSPVKQFAVKNNLPVLQPSNLKSPAFIEELRAYKANLQVVVAFRMLPEAVWSMPEYGTINLHGSLLPDYRGAAPINWVLINGEMKTGLTTFFIRQEIDTGNIILQEEIDILPDDDAGTLHDRMMERGGILILKTIRAVEDKNYEAVKQHDSPDLKKAPKIFREMCEINWNQDPLQVYNFVRGLSPFPGAWAVIKGKLYKIYKVNVVQTNEKIENPGDYISDLKSYLNFHCSGGMVSIEELQPEGKRRMSVKDFFRGNSL